MEKKPLELDSDLTTFTMNFFANLQANQKKIYEDIQKNYKSDKEDN